MNIHIFFKNTTQFVDLSVFCVHTWCCTVICDVCNIPHTSSVATEWDSPKSGQNIEVLMGKTFLYRLCDSKLAHEYSCLSTILQYLLNDGWFCSP